MLMLIYYVSTTKRFLSDYEGPTLKEAEMSLRRDRKNAKDNGKNPKEIVIAKITWEIVQEDQ